MRSDDQVNQTDNTNDDNGSDTPVLVVDNPKYV